MGKLSNGKWKWVVTASGLALAFALVLGPAACTPATTNPASGAAATVAAAQRGDLIASISSAGSLALSEVVSPAFETAGTVAEVLVEVGDPVKKGDTLARLDETEFRNLLDTLQTALISAQRTLTSRQRAVISSQVSLLNAQVALELARQTTQITGQNTATISNEDDIAIKTMQVDIAQSNLADANTAVADAQRNVDQAQKNYDETKKASILVTAPFDGFVTVVSVKGGQIIYKGQAAVDIADPAKFEAQLLVGEMDIFKVAVGTPALVGIDAVSGLSVPAKVTKISPTATISGGVVNYVITVQLDTSTGAQQGPATGQGSDATTTRPGSTGRVPGSGSQAMGTTGGAEQRAMFQVPAAAAQISQLKQGLSVTVEILAGNKQNVIMVPNRAIIRQGRTTTVQIAGTDPVETRTVKVGINNSQYTEITSGLEEGEKVIVQASTSASSTPNRAPTGFGGMTGGIRIPGR
jgi:multidrug efflux pump subunit AcrA (membrane-fusion protein)